MADILTQWQYYTGADWQVLGPGLAQDDGLFTAVVISLFTDAEANPDDVLPDGTNDRRGWWGDLLAEVDGDRIGSRLWLLSREKLLPETITRAKEYTDEALQWLLADGVASQVVVTAEVIARGCLGLSVEISRPGQAPVQYQFRTFWGE